MTPAETAARLAESDRSWPRKRTGAFATLARLSSTGEVERALGELAVGYGRVAEVSALVPEPDAGTANRHFIVRFDRTQDAIHAARDWHCRMVGFTSVMVSIMRGDTVGSMSE